MYQQLQEKNLEFQKKAKEEARIANEQTQAGEYDKAVLSFANCLTLSQLFLDSGCPELALCYFNYGQALQHAGQSEKAIAALSYAQHLVEQAETKNRPLLEKLTIALSECQSSSAYAM